MRADRALVSAFCLQKQKPVSLLELCSASALYSFCKRVVWILSAVYYAHFFMWKKKKKKPLKIAATQHCLSFDFFRLVNMTLWTLSAKWLSSELNKHTNKSNNDQTYLSWRYWPSPPGLPKPVDLVPSSGRPLLPCSLAWIFPPLPPTPLPHGRLLLLQISAHWSLLPKSLAWSEHFIQGFPHPASSACFLHNNLSKLSGDWGRKKNPIVQNHALRKWVTWV